jgi:hypothetical protein
VSTPKSATLYQSHFPQVVFHIGLQRKAPRGIENKEFGTNLARLSDEVALTEFI